MAKIEPTVGRVVWFWPLRAHERSEQPRAASIAAVCNNGRINIGYLSEIGVHLNACEIELWDGQGERPRGPHCEWMPYQKGQAAKTEALEKAVTEGHRAL